MNSYKQKAVSGVKWTTIGTVGKSLFQLIQIAILTRFLSKEDFGLVSMAIVVIQFTAIFVDMGMTSAILHIQNATKKEYSSIYWLNIFISIIIYISLYFSKSIISEFYKEPELINIIPILGLNILIMAAGRQHRTLMQKNFQFKDITLIQISSFFVGLIIAVWLAVKGYGVFSLIYSTLTASIVSNFLFLYKNIIVNPIIFHFKFKEVKPFFKIGSYTMGSSFLDFFSREADILIIGRLLGAKSLGVYTLVKQITIKLYSIIVPVLTNVLTPLFASIQEQRNRLKFQSLEITRYLATFVYFIYSIIILLSKEILHILYGPSYSDAYIILSFMAVSYAILATSNPIGSLQIATGRTDLGFKWTIFRIIVTPPVIYIGALFNIETVAILYAILTLFMIIPFWYMLLKPMINVSLNDYIKQFYKPFIFLIVILLILVFFSNNIFIVNNILVAIIFKTIIAIICYIVFLYIFDRKNLFEIIKNIKSIVPRKSSN